MSVSVGSTIASKYQIQCLLGKGGMGTVYLAKHLLLDIPVAIKFLNIDVSAHPLARARLLREGQALARLRGPHIARVLDAEVMDDGTCFLVLEYLKGEHLGRLLERKGSLAVVDAIGYTLEVCEALAEAHRAGIIHRDIKPSNLFLASLEDGTRCIKLIDFGISKLVTSSSESTSSRTIVGSPCYMAPEQMRCSGTVDTRCDIWSLGVLLYEMLVGAPPHHGTSILEICAAILDSDPASPRAIRPEVPREIDLAVRRSLARDPNNRFSSVQEFAQALLPHSGTGGGQLTWIIPAALHGSAIEHVSSETPCEIRPGQTLAESCPKRPWPGLLAPGLLAVGLATGTLFMSALIKGSDRQGGPAVQAVGSKPPPQEPQLRAPQVGPLPAREERSTKVKAVNRNTSQHAVHRGQAPAPRPPVTQLKDTANQERTRAPASSAVPPVGVHQNPVLQYGRF